MLLYNTLHYSTARCYYCPNCPQSGHILCVQDWHKPLRRKPHKIYQPIITHYITQWLLNEYHCSAFINLPLRDQIHCKPTITITTHLLHSYFLSDFIWLLACNFWESLNDWFRSNWLCGARNFVTLVEFKGLHCVKNLRFPRTICACSYFSLVICVPYITYDIICVLSRKYNYYHPVLWAYLSQ